jgi:hypothetical protein
MRLRASLSRCVRNSPGISRRSSIAGAHRRAVAGVATGKQTIQASAVHRALSAQNIELLTQRLIVSDAAGRRVATVFTGRRAGDGLLLVGMLRSDVWEVSVYESAFTALVDSVRMNAPPASVTGRSAIAKPGIVSGTIYDAHGRPFQVPGARVVVHIWGAGAGGDRGSTSRWTRPDTTSRVFRTGWLPLNGQTVCVDLEPLDGRPTETALDSTAGIVRDFGLGTIQGYHGGSLTVTDGANWKNPIFGAMSRRYPAGTKVGFRRSRLVRRSTDQRLRRYELCRQGRSGLPAESRRSRWPSGKAEPVRAGLTPARGVTSARTAWRGNPCGSRP